MCLENPVHIVEWNLSKIYLRELEEFALMELELIEPALYFRMDKESPKTFAETFDGWMKRRNYP